MAKAKTLIAPYKRPSIKALREELREYKDGYTAARNESAALQNQLETLQTGYDDLREQKTKSWEVAGRWEKRAGELERDKSNLEQELGEKARHGRYLQGQIDRCIGYIAAHHQEHPVPEAVPKVETRAVDEYLSRPNSGGGWTSKPRSQWRDDLGIDRY